MKTVSIDYNSTNMTSNIRYIMLLSFYDSYITA